MHVHGACHCGAIAFEAELDPARVAVCHCTDCQITSGAPYRPVAQVAASDFQLLKGSPRHYEKLGDSGNRRVLSFCENCGTHVFATAAEPEPAMYSVRLCTLEERAELSPRIQVWCSSALPWVADVSTLHGLDRQNQ